MAGVYRSADSAALVHGRLRKMLHRWPVPSERLRVPTCEGETFIVASGPRDAEPRVLLHGTTPTHSGSLTYSLRSVLHALQSRTSIVAGARHCLGDRSETILAFLERG